MSTRSQDGDARPCVVGLRREFDRIASGRDQRHFGRIGRGMLLRVDRARTTTTAAATA
ncbi:MAG: hypothetical protein LKM39_17715 [Chiayiivirga sp.]|nr:hypothetical protein [Chiayiivirga sp.]